LIQKDNKIISRI